MRLYLLFPKSSFFIWDCFKFLKVPFSFGIVSNFAGENHRGLAWSLEPMKKVRGSEFKP